MQTRPLSFKMPNNWISTIAQIIGIQWISMRRQISHQLSRRTVDDFSFSWRKIDVDHHLVLVFCIRLKNELGWPNHFFYPNDPLHFLLIPKGLGMNDVDFLSECRTRYKSDDEHYNELLDSLSTVTVHNAIRLLTEGGANEVS